MYLLLPPSSVTDNVAQSKVPTRSSRNLYSSKSLTVTGTVISNETKFEWESVQKKLVGGSSDQLVRQDKKMVLVKRPLVECNRRSKVENKYIHISQPEVVEEYNTLMNGVDLLDRVSRKDKKRTLPFINQFFDFVAAASCLEYCEEASSAGLEKMFHCTRTSL